MSELVFPSKIEPKTLTTPVTIEIYPTSCRVFLENDKLSNGLYIHDFLRYLQVYTFNNTTRKWLIINRYWLYSEKTKVLSIPRFYLKLLVNFIKLNKGIYTLVHANTPAGRDIELPINPWWVPRDYQIDAINYLAKKHENAKFKMRALPLRTGQGKAQPLYSKIKIPNGWTTMGELKVGDIIIGYNGMPTKVTEIHLNGIKDVYRITFEDDRYTDVTEEHLWRVAYSNKKIDNNIDIKTQYSIIKDNTDCELITTKDIIENILTKKMYIPLCHLEETKSKFTLIEPWIFGVLLSGDFSNENEIKLCTDKNIINLLKSRLIHDCDIEVIDESDQYSTIIIIKNNENGINYYYETFKKLNILINVNNKIDVYRPYIPKEYMNNNFWDILSLLKGIFDVNGNVKLSLDKAEYNSIEFSTEFEQLAKDIQYIIRSLGGICKISIIDRNGKVIYLLDIKYRSLSSLFNLDRKAGMLFNKYSQDDNCLKLGIKSVEYIGKHECQCITIDSTVQLYITDDFIVTHNSFSSLYAASLIAKPVIIIVGRLIDQWYTIITTGSDGKPPIYNIDINDIYVIKGADSVINLVNNTDYYPKVIIASLQTLRLYIAHDQHPYTELPLFDTVVERLGIGTKIFDESHENFSAIVDIDLRTNIEHNLYLSATFLRSDREESDIYLRIFPNIIMFNDINEFKKYQHIYYYSYSLGHIWERKVTSRKYGFSQLKYESLICKKIELFNAYIKIINDYFCIHYLNIKKENQKCLIICATRKFSEKVYEYFKDKYLNLKFILRYGDNEESVENYDVIVSTFKKSGTGFDVVNLKCLINTISFGNEIGPIQTLGRLRELENDEPIYVALWNRSLSAHRRHKEKSSKIYKKYAKIYIEI